MTHAKIISSRQLLSLWLCIMAVGLAVVIGAAGAQAFVPNGFAGGDGNYLQSMVEGGVYRWAPNRLPLRVYIEDGEGVSGYRPQFRQIMREAFDSWMQAAGGKLTWVEVSDPRQAHIATTWSDTISIRNGNLEAGRTTAIMETDRRTGRRWMAAAEVKILTRIGRKIFSDDEIRKTVLHEVGHALGLQGHSPLNSDIMYASLSRSQVPFLQDRDAATIQALYAGYPQAGNDGDLATAPTVTMAPRAGVVGVPASQRRQDSGYSSGNASGYSSGNDAGYGSGNGGGNGAGYSSGNGGGYGCCGNGYRQSAGSGGYAIDASQLRAAKLRAAAELVRRYYNSRLGTQSCGSP